MAELDKSIEKEVAVTTIKSIMEDNDISIVEIPGGERITQLGYSFVEAKTYAANIYEKLMDEIGEDAAYEWAADNIPSNWRTEIGIRMPKRYKTVVVNISVPLLVPNTFEDYEIKDLALCCVDNSCDFTIDLGETGLQAEDVCEDDYKNDVKDFSESDWDV